MPWFRLGLRVRDELNSYVAHIDLPILLISKPKGENFDFKAKRQNFDFDAKKAINFDFDAKKAINFD